MTHGGDNMIRSVFGGLPSPWDERRRRHLAILAYRAGHGKLKREWPRDIEDSEHRLAVAVGTLRAALGY